MLAVGVFLVKFVTLTAIFYLVLFPHRDPIPVLGELPEPRAPRVQSPAPPPSATVIRKPVAPLPPRPEPPEPNDPIEQQLLAMLRAHPEDHASRMVYGDWLEARGEVAKSSFVRGTESLSDLPILVKTTGIAWRATISDERVACTTTLCPDRWTGFRAIENDARRRSCPRCGTIMHYCADRTEIQTAAARGELAVLDLVDVVQPTGFDTTDVERS